MLGDDIQSVEVQSADSIASSLLRKAVPLTKPFDHDAVNYLLRQAINVTQFAGNAVQQQAQRQAVERLSTEYLHQEINQVIVARQLKTREEYLAASRPGRKVRLNALQRRAIWAVHETLQHLLKQQGKATWRQIRAMALAGQRSVPSACGVNAELGKPWVKEGRANFGGP